MNLATCILCFLVTVLIVITKADNANEHCGGYCNFTQVRKRCQNNQELQSINENGKPCGNQRVNQLRGDCLRTHNCKRKRTVPDLQRTSLLRTLIARRNKEPEYGAFDQPSDLSSYFIGDVYQIRIPAWQERILKLLAIMETGMEI
ncbi:uncharacterized protein LOC110987777 [Acanthaster planci]|uniref:Uncharacterized protein LOC110987777 n=1 Tax=Acanthaster planci TaxID=133434 RepID=A0A8B7ZLQ0_ACAPL|nr:uncharacterized protein LOC110987777 [Acanthaster planci]